MSRYLQLLLVVIVAASTTGFWWLRPAKSPPKLAIPRESILSLQEPTWIQLSGGAFLVGTDLGPPECGPATRITLSAFEMTATEITNAQFAQFVAATGYATEAERRGYSLVLHPDSRRMLLLDGADWQHPLGENSSILGKEEHPVVHVSWHDANAYAQHVGGTLPSEFQWEFAARGGSLDPPPSSDDQPLPQTVSVSEVQPNPFGIAGTSANVCEWTSGWFSRDGYLATPEHDPTGPFSGTKRVVRGGSWADASIPVWYRSGLSPETSNNFTGFRCVRPIE